MTIHILLCDTFPGLLPSYIPSYVSMFFKLFDSLQQNIQYRVYRTMDGELPDLNNPDGLYLITGCNLSAYDHINWIQQLLKWIESANECKAKLTGICFGHQCIAQALGGKVERAPQGWGTGIRESRIVDEMALPYFPDQTMRLLYNHHDQVVVLPDNAKLVATSDFCPIESYRIGNHILTFQGHPEYIPEYNRHLLENFSDDESFDVRQSALYSLKNMKHQGNIVGRMILDFANAGR